MTKRNIASVHPVKFGYADCKKCEGQGEFILTNYTFKMDCLDCGLRRDREEAQKNRKLGEDHWIRLLDGCPGYETHAMQLTVDKLPLMKSKLETPTESTCDVPVSINASKQARAVTNFGGFNEHAYFVRIQGTRWEEEHKDWKFAMEGQVEAVVQIYLGTNCGMYWASQITYTSADQVKSNLKALFSVANDGTEFYTKADYLMHTLGFLPLSLKGCTEKSLLQERKKLFGAIGHRHKSIRLVFDGSKDNDLYDLTDCNSDDEDEEDDQEEEEEESSDED